MAPQKNPIHFVDLSSKNSTEEKELAIVKVSFKKDKQSNIKKIAKKFKAKSIFENLKNLAFEITDSPDNINAFIAKLNVLGKIDVSRTGLIAITKD